MGIPFGKRDGVLAAGSMVLFADPSTANKNIFYTSRGY